MSDIRESLRFPNAVVFAASFVLMSLELVAGRFMAPYLGVSIYTWTSIIGVILLGISIGNWLGGKLADTDLKRDHLSTLFLAAGVATLLVLFIVPAIGKPLAVSRMPLMFSALIFATFTFLPASLILGAISPMVVKFDLTDLGKTGRTVGRISAFGTLGSILGTFATGFFLIDVFGTASIIRLAALALLLLGAVVRTNFRWASKQTAALGIFMATSFLVPTLCTEETQYYCIRVTEDEEFLLLRLDHLVHSYVSQERVGELGYEYEKVYATLMEASGTRTPRVLYVGGGGYTMPRYVEQFYPGSENVVIEIDPGVTEVVHERFGLPRDTAIRSVNRDGRIALQRMPAEERYDFIFGDAFNDYSVPYHLTTREFHALVKAHLTPGGYYAVNIIDDARHGRFLASTVKTLQSEFAHVIVIPLGEDWKTKGRNTYVVVAGENPLPHRYPGTAPRGVAIEGEDSARVWERLHHVVPAEEMAAFVEEKKGIVLTDGYVPVDTMLAPLFADDFGGVTD